MECKYVIHNLDFPFCNIINFVSMPIYKCPMDILEWTFLCSDKLWKNKCLIEWVVLLLVFCIICDHFRSFLICEWIAKITFKITKQMWFHKKILKIVTITTTINGKNRSLDKKCPLDIFKVSKNVPKYTFSHLFALFHFRTINGATFLKPRIAVFHYV